MKKTFITCVYRRTPGWNVVGVADFNGDGHPDYLLFNSSTRQTAIWYLNNNVLMSGLYGTYSSCWLERSRGSRL